MKRASTSEAGSLLPNRPREDEKELSAEAASSLLQMLETNKLRDLATMGTPKALVRIPPKYSPKKRKISKSQKNSEPTDDYQHDQANDGISYHIPSGWRSWTHEEEVFLIGSVMERFFSRGSLSSTKRKQTDSENCWSGIKSTYDFAWLLYSKSSGKKQPSTRSENALARHYKVMKERIMHTELGDDFRRYYHEWETQYNIQNCLVTEEGADILSRTNSQKGESLLDLPKSRWSYEEEVFLVAAVLERFFQRGSLASSRGDSGSSECWASIKVAYDIVRTNYATHHGKQYTVKRSSPALARHFKVMKVRFTESNGQENLKSYYHDWKYKYNVDEVLLKPLNLSLSKDDLKDKTIVDNAVADVVTSRGDQANLPLPFWITNPIANPATMHMQPLQISPQNIPNSGILGGGLMGFQGGPFMPQDNSQLFYLSSLVNVIYGTKNSGNQISTRT